MPQLMALYLGCAERPLKESPGPSSAGVPAGPAGPGPGRGGPTRPGAAAHAEGEAEPHTGARTPSPARSVRLRAAARERSLNPPPGLTVKRSRASGRLKSGGDIAPTERRSAARADDAILLRTARRTSRRPPASSPHPGPREGARHAGRLGAWLRAAVPGCSRLPPPASRLGPSACAGGRLLGRCGECGSGGGAGGPSRLSVGCCRSENYFKRSSVWESGRCGCCFL